MNNRSDFRTLSFVQDYAFPPSNFRTCPFQCGLGAPVDWPSRELFGSLPMIRFLAVPLSAVVMAGLVYVVGPIVFVGLPLIVLGMLVSEMQHRQQHHEPREGKGSRQATDF